LDPPTIEQRASAAEQGHNCTEGVISAIAYFGNETRYHVRLASGLELRVSRTNAARHQDTQLSRDQKVFAWWDGADIVVLTQ
jgi:putrescine transport system ATP-binding protein